MFNSDFGKFGKLDGLIQWDLEQLLLPSKYSEYLLISCVYDMSHFPQRFGLVNNIYIYIRT